jgi:hypothetical protein
MLEHLHGHHAIELPAGNEFIHVGSDDHEVAEIFRAGLPNDELALRGGIRNGDDA